MSEFSVKVRKIREINKHPNADKLDLASIEDNTYQFVVGRNEFKVGDLCVYIPIDAILSDELSIYLNIKNFLSGKEHNRTKTVKLRGAVSQGVCISADKIKQYLQGKNILFNPGTITADLKVEKYEPPEILEKGAKLVRLPEDVESYDIEGCDNYPDIVNYMMDKLVYISEKTEGSNLGVSITPESKIIVNQHNYAIEPLEGQTHTWIIVAEECGIMEFVKKLQEIEYPGKQITVRAEILGQSIQGDIYKLPKRTLRIYDIKIDGRYIGVDEYFRILNDYDMIKYTVPVIARNVILKEWLQGKTIQEASNGKSLLNPEILREGIVIKPMVEEFVNIGKFQGRLIIKQRSPEYLAKEK